MTRVRRRSPRVDLCHDRTDANRCARTRCFVAPAFLLREEAANVASMTSSCRTVLVAAILAGCAGSPAVAQRSETAPPAPSAGQPDMPVSAYAGPGSADAVPKGAAPPAPSAESSAEPPAQPPRPHGASIDIAVVGKHAGDAAVDRVIQGVRTGLQNCYEAGLESAPAANGTVEFRIKVGDSGAIKKVESANPHSMPGSVTTCMVGRFGALSFEPRPATTIEVKVTCRPND